MKKNQIARCICIVAALGAVLFMSCAEKEQQSSIKRTELQRHKISAGNWETIQVRIDFAQGSKVGKHTHPGEEVIFVLKGLLEYKVEGRPAVTLRSGDVLFIPKGVIHSAENMGETSASELATYIVENGKQLVAPVK